MADIISVYGKLLLEAMGQTLIMAFYSLIFASIIGLIFGMLSVLKSKVCNVIAQIFVDIIRGVPMIVLAFFVFFGIPYALKNFLHSTFTFTALQAGIICLSLNCGAYMSEIIRAGIQAVDQGQMEGGRSLGLSYVQTMKDIILPQAIKNILPALGNEFIVLLKETAIAGYVSLTDLTRAANQISSRTYEAFMPLIGAAVIYFVIIKILTILLGKLERRLRKSDNR